jgi:hypothetical protein
VLHLVEEGSYLLASCLLSLNPSSLTEVPSMVPHTLSGDNMTMFMFKTILDAAKILLYQLSVLLNKIKQRLWEIIYIVLFRQLV